MQNSKRKNTQINEQYQNDENLIHPKKYKYDIINGKKIGKGWLESTQDAPMPVQNYRSFLLASLDQARNKYLERLKIQGQIPNQILTRPINKSQNLKTVDPEIPNFASKRNQMHKFAGACIKSMYSRYFTVDSSNFKYYVGEKDIKLKKSLELKDAQAFMQEKSEVMNKQSGGSKQQLDEWVQPNMKYRVGIQLQGRKMKSIYYYTQSLYEAKFLLVNIQLYGNSYKAATMANSIELSYLIEKASRFQKIIRLMCFSKEKRFVSMNTFQQISVDMIYISQQALEIGRDLALKWFINMLDEDDKPIIRSAFRSANPKPIKKSKVLKEVVINKLIQQLSKFIQNRKMNRQQIISKEISRQIYEETTGISIENISMKLLNQNKYENILQIDNKQASLIFDSEDCYKYMIIENKSLIIPQQAQKSIQSVKKNQAQNLIKKVDIGQVSFISTDLDQTTQFDFNNKLNKQSYYKIRLYGPIIKLENNIDQGEQIAPCQIGLDFIRMKKKQYKISITKIKFPSELAKRDNEKVTLFVKVNQYAEVDGVQPISFDTTSQCIKIKGNNSGVVYPNDQGNQIEKNAVFNLSKISNLDKEYFSLSLIVRKNEKPIQQCTERFLEHQELNSYDFRQIFNYKKVNTEQIVQLKDKEGNQFEITFLLENAEVDSSQINIQEKSGKRLLVGKYVFYQGRVNYVRSLNNNLTVDIVDTFSKKERKVQIQNIQLIESHGCSIFKLDQEPNLIKQSTFDWIIDLKVKDKRILNSIHSKIQTRQAHLTYFQQDTKIPEPLNSIEGEITISLMEIKGLIAQDEVNRRQINKNTQLDFYVELRLENFQQKIFKTEKSQSVKNKREINWQQQSGQQKNEKEPIFIFQNIRHSKTLPQSEIKLEKSNVRKALKKNKPQQADEDKKFLHLIVRNEQNGLEIGAAKIEIDELIDVNLNDLAKEYCVCLNRSHIVDQLIEKQVNAGNDREKVQKQLSMFTLYSGIIRFQTLFQPTKDTCLRFVKLRDTKSFKTPNQLLHFENLLQKSVNDQYQFKIPQINYNPNIRNLGENYINLQNLIEQSASIPAIQIMLKRLQTKKNDQDSQSQVKPWQSFENQKINEQILIQIDQKLKFQSPFEQLNIILKLQRKERPFIEPIFFNFKNIWEIYKQLVKNQAFDSLNLNEWLSFIDELSGKHNFKQLDDLMEEAFDQDPNDLDKSDALTQKSFVGDMVKQMHSKAADFGRKSVLLAKQLEQNQNNEDQKNFSLVLCKEWQKEGNQSFIDLVNLIKCGIPQMLRTVVWSDLMKTNLIAIEEKKTMIQNYPNKYNKQVSVFQNFVEISQKYDCIAFKQIDQDISDFRFPAFYYDDVENEGIRQAGIADMNLDNVKLNRANKFKQDKQKMRKLLRILLVWGKTFKYKGINYQFCYPTGFLKFAHRLLNLMSIEEAFWIVIGLVRQYPRLWCLQESSLLDDAKSIFRFEHTVFRAILEANFPEVAQKLYDLGLPIEVLIYESITSLYCDQFHSDTLLRIWDQLIFYFNTTDQTSRRRGIWLLLAPALLIIQQKQDQIFRSKTIKEVIQCYNDGCGINYNPNHIIQLLNDLIDDVFVTEGKQTNKLLQNASNLSLVESGGTGSGNLVQTNKSIVAQKNQSVGFLSGIFSVFVGSNNIDQAPQKIDLIRRKYQEMQNLIFDNQRFKNKIVSDFLFDPKDSKQKSQNIKSQQNSDKKSKLDDDMEFDEGNKFKKDQQKPNSHQYLDYKKWRVDILSKLNSQFLKAEDILDEDLHEFDDKDIYNKQQLDISQMHIYLHNLENWYGSASQQSSEFKVQVQYGKLNSNGNFEVKSQTKEDQLSIRNDQSLQFFCTFNYKNGYNNFKIRILTVDSNQNICHCYGNLRGLQRGKIIQIKQFMNTKEYTQNAESQFSLTQIKMSLYLESKKDEDKGKLNNQKQDQQQNQIAYLSSIKKLETNYINIYKPQKEKIFQKTLHQSLYQQLEFENTNLKQYLPQTNVNEILNYKYKFINIAPFNKFCSLPQQLFKEFLVECLPEHYRSINFTELNQLYKDFLIGKSNMNIKPSESIQQIDSFDNINKIESKQVIVDTEKLVNDNNQNQNQLVQLNEKYFSLRSFVQSILFMSPITVNEKLDILYDISDIGNQNIDGIDIEDAQFIYQSILQQHQYFIPFNELRTAVENVFNMGEVSGIVAAYWTTKQVNEIKYDIQIENYNIIKLEEFINQSSGFFGNQSQIVNNQPIIDLTQEIQNTFQMYQNLFGNKIIDLNQDTSPFKHLNNLLAGTGKSDLGETLLQKTLLLDENIGKKYRVVLISVVQSGERITTEINYNLQTGLIIIDDQIQKLIKKEDQSYKKFLIRNQNILDLSGNQLALGKNLFLQESKKIPFVCDLLRAETMWQDRKLDSSQQQEKSGYGSSQTKIQSMRMKKRFQPVVNIFMSDKEKIFIFKFENKVMGGKSDQTSIKELVPKQIYLFELEALYLEDIILDMRDRITIEISKIIERGMQLSDGFLTDIEGKMEFYVRKISADEEEQLGKNQKKIQNLKWNWKSVNDFDRIQKFSDDEVFEDEVIFKLIKSQTENEEILDEKSQAYIDGYDCFSIYKHSDNSYEWRLCKIVGKQMRPEYKNLSIEAFNDIYNKKRSGKSDVEDHQLTSRKMNEIDQFYYFLEFYHLRQQGKEMWIKRRREDVIFSQRYSRDQQSFESNCFKFIMDKYKN